MQPAQRIIDICGGVPAVAAMTGRNASRVYRWTYPRERGGTGGVVPWTCMVALLREAPRRGIDLRPEHFMPGTPESDDSEKDAA